MSVIAVYREFGSLDRPVIVRLPDGLNLEQLRGRMRCLPADFAGNGTICINGHPAPRALGAAIRPKPMDSGVPIEVTFHAPAMGGGEEGGKNILALVAGIALTALTGFIAGGGLAAKLGFSAKLFNIKIQRVHKSIGTTPLPTGFPYVILDADIASLDSDFAAGSFHRKVGRHHGLRDVFKFLTLQDSVAKRTDVRADCG